MTFTSSRSTKIPTKARLRASRGDPAGVDFVRIFIVRVITYELKDFCER